MEGSFADWFLVTGTEYYKNGNIRFIVEFNNDGTIKRNYIIEMKQIVSN